MSVEINLSKEAMSRYEAFAAHCKVPVEKLIEIILEQYVKAGGKTDYGSWEEGVRVVVAWPIRAGYSIVKVSKEV